MNVIKKLLLILVSSFFDMIIFALIIRLIMLIMLVYSDCTYFDSGEEFRSSANDIIQCITALAIYSAFYIPVRYFLLKFTLKTSFNKCVMPVFIILIAVSALPLVIDGILVIFGVFVFHDIFTEALSLHGEYMMYDSFEPMTAYIPLFLGISGAWLRCQMIFFLLRDKKKAAIN
jgi:hypothetical protein